MKLLLDEMLHASIARELRKRGHDVEAIQGNVELEGQDDVAVLRLATASDRALVTDSVDDLMRLYRLFLADGEDHVGILLASSRNLPRSKQTIGVWVKTLHAFLRSNPTSPKNECRWLVGPEAAPRR